MASQTLSCIVFDISAIDRDLSFLNVIKTVQKVGNRRFSGTGRTDKCHFLAGMRIQVNVFQNHFIRIVTKGNIFHDYFTFDIVHLYRIRFICLFRLFIHYLEHTLRTGKRGKDRIDLHGDLVDRAAELAGVVYKYCQSAKTEPSGKTEQTTDARCDTVTDLSDVSHDRPHDTAKELRFDLFLTKIIIQIRKFFHCFFLVAEYFYYFLAGYCLFDVTI